MSELRSWFLRNVLEAAERQLGTRVVAGLLAKLPPRLVPHASLERLRAAAAFDTVPLDEGEELLLSVDSLLGDGSGKLLESIGVDLTSRMLSQGGSVVRSGDLAGTVARLHAFLEHPFVGAPLLFELRRNATGFSLTLGLTGHSRATRAVRHLTIGAVIASERFARDVGAESLKIFADGIADRSNINAHYLPLGVSAAEHEPPRSRRPVPTRPPAASLSAEVERILRSSSPPRSASEPVPASASESRRPRAAESVPRPPQSARREIEEAGPESIPLRVGNASPARGPATK